MLNQPNPAPTRAPYTAPTLEPLGSWSTLTLAQTIPVTPDQTF